jgi:histone H3/H4
LRDLSRALARDSRPVEPSPPATTRRSRPSALDLPDVEDSPNAAAPRFSMALDDMYDEDSYHEHAPRQSLLPDVPDDVDGGTVQSLEFGRRAISEDPRFLFPGRLSERFGDLSELGAVEEEFEIDGTFINRRNTLLDHGIDEALDEDDTTTQMRALTGRRDGRSSDVDLGVFGDADDDTEEPTFRFNIPERIRAPARDEPREEEIEPDQEEELPLQIEDDKDQDPPEDNEQDEVTAALNGDDATEPQGIQGWESDPEPDDDNDLAAYREEESAIDRSLQSPERRTPAKERNVRKAKEVRISQRGLEYPSFPAASVKKLALGFMKSQGSKASLNKDTLAALVKVTDDFFEQIGIDLAAYAQHGGRKVIEESDVIALMKRYGTFISVQSCTPH